MEGTDRLWRRGLLPLLSVSVVVVLVTFGFARGWWLSNTHNGLLALAFAFVGAYVLYQRPGHREGLLFQATGVVEAVVFFGRQVGHSPASAGSRWWGWLGVWPLVVALALTTMTVICFPDGRLPSRSWRPMAFLVGGVTVFCAVLSAGWPVEYESAELVGPHPISADAPQAVSAVWSAVAHPAYIGFQLLWVIVLVARWRVADEQVRRQLVWLVSAAAVSATALVIGLVVAGSPRAGLLSAALVPIAAGWAIVHGQHAVAYSALSWLSRSGARSTDLPADVTRAAVDALSASGATLWMGTAERLHAVGVWPPTVTEIEATDLNSLQSARTRRVRPTTRAGAVTGALSVDRTDRLSLSEERLFVDLAAQAALVVDHLSLADLIAGERKAGNLTGLRPREQEVLELMSRGLSNAAICSELHLSIKTVEPIVSAIFSKLELHMDAGSNRRVLAVLAYLRG